MIETIKTFNEACNFLSEQIFAEKLFNKYDIHKKYYRILRNTFNISSQFAIRIIGKVSNSYIFNKNNLHVFKEFSSVNLDKWLLSFKNNICSIATLTKRIKVEWKSRFNIYELNKTDSAKLLYDKKLKKFYILISHNKECKDVVACEGFLGVDLGISQLAVSSNKKFYSGKRVKHVRKRYAKQRQQLQQKGTKSAKRKLKNNSGKESRFMRDVNHCISSGIVKDAKALNLGIKLEDLKGIKEKTVRKASKGVRKMLGGWAFAQLRGMIEYKASIAGVGFHLVSPAYTSQKCPKCHNISVDNRKVRSKFQCVSCGFTQHADYVGSMNISSATIILPKTKQKLFRNVSDENSRDKPTTSIVG